MPFALSILVCWRPMPQTSSMLHHFSISILFCSVSMAYTPISGITFLAKRFAILQSALEGAMPMETGMQVHCCTFCLMCAARVV